LTFSIGDANFRNNEAVVLSGFSADGDFYSVNLLVGPGGTRNVFDYEVSSWKYIAALYNISP